MKILIVGSDEIFAIENFYVRYLRDLGVEVAMFPSQTIFSRHYRRSVISKAVFKLGLSRIYSKINHELKFIVEEERPDVIWVFKGMEVYASTLVWIRQRGIKLVNYNPDNPFIFSGAGSGNKNIAAAISLYDLHFTYNKSVQTQLESKLRVKVGYLPFGFDVAEDLYQRLGTLPEIIATSFIGNPDKERAAFISRLADHGIEIHVYGHHWPSFVTNSNIIVHEAVYGNDLPICLRKYRVQLNLMRPHNLDSHNMRTFEVPGVGGIMVAPKTGEHQTFFVNGKECFLFEDAEECAQIINTVLKSPEKDCSNLRIAARSRSVNSKYSYKDRAVQALSIIQTLA